MAESDKNAINQRNNEEREQATTLSNTKALDITLLVKLLAVLTFTGLLMSSCVCYMLTSIDNVNQSIKRDLNIIKQDFTFIDNVLHRTNKHLESIDRNLMNIVHYMSTLNRQTIRPSSHLGFPPATSPEYCYDSRNTDIDATGDALKVAVVSEISTVNLTIGSLEENCFSLVKSLLTCELWSESGTTKVQCTKKRKALGQYELNYTPTEQGRYNLHINVDGEHIKGSPFFVTVIRKLGKPKKIISGLVGPRGIAFTKTSKIVVAEYEAHQVTILSSLGKRIKSFGSKGKEEGQFFHPCGVAVDGDGNILVVDGKNDRIQKFAPDGEFIAAVGMRQSENHMDLNYPIGIGIHPRTKKIYVVENKGNRAQTLNPDLSYNNTFGHFHEPKDVAFDSKGNVYVADNENCRIQVFTADGQFLRQFGRENGIDLNYPTAISIDSYDIIYVLELYTHRVSLFTCEDKAGRCQNLTSFGSEGNGPGEFNQARGMAVDENGMLYVSDQGNKNIQVF